MDDKVAAKQRMLRLWVALSGTPEPSAVSILTTDKTLVTADSILPNGSQTLFATTNLMTPLGRYPTAVVRAQDIAQIDTKLSSEQLHELLRS
ncbi:hypothetical protein Poli38472_004193 [Pythium oligandrum]|uniref:Uncharacterized protein n=1 Tax=Pythium oligandrum TaxID=41045 RepID=A0A8K1CQB6_PYTOL|nr:hypothetical protein Poli38472_004193 [Pythium oligandrum]|eukprot:TMW66428.1 hypothetical protein Poli38472_004193 [Pythium oligandrum]